MRYYTVSDSSYFIARPVMHFRTKKAAQKKVMELIREVQEEASNISRYKLCKVGSLKSGNIELRVGSRQGYHVYYSVSIFERDTESAIYPPTKFED